MTKEEQYDLDDLEKYDKKSLTGKTFIVDDISDEVLGENGFFKMMFIKVDSDTVNGFTFISSDSALDKRNVIGIPVTIEKVMSKNKREYYKFIKPAFEQKLVEDTPEPKNRAKRKIKKPETRDPK